MKFVCSFLLALCFVSAAAQSVVGNDQQDVVFRSVNVVPMDREQVLENKDVVARSGRIAAIGATGKVSFGKGAIIVDGKGKYLIPGLAEIHAHVPPVDDIA